MAAIPMDGLAYVTLLVFHLRAEGSRERVRNRSAQVSHRVTEDGRLGFLLTQPT